MEDVALVQGEHAGEEDEEDEEAAGVGKLAC